MPKSAYNFYVAEVRAKVKEENPDMKFGDISKKVGEMWKALSEEEKKPYQEMADKNKEEGGEKKTKKEKKEKKESKCKKAKKDKKEEEEEDEEKAEDDEE